MFNKKQYNKIMDCIEVIKEYVTRASEKYKSESEDRYDFWNEHIKYVFAESVKLAKKYGADIEIVSLGALLHDIALIEKVGTKVDHHINGEKIARKVLDELNYDPAKKERVLKCVYNHRSSKNAETIEEICVADADILAHFNNIPMMFHAALIRNKVILGEVNKWMDAAFEKDFNDLSDRTKASFVDRYKLIREIVIKK